MSNISIQLKNLGHSALALKNNLVVLFYLGLIILLIFEALTVKSAISQALASQRSQPPSRTVQKIRVNFIDYNAAVERINTTTDFEPNLDPKTNPFRAR